MPDGDERDLIQGLKERREDAWRLLWESHRADVYRHVVAEFARNGSEDDAEDITQNALLRAYRDIAGFEGRSRLRTWLIGIARHAAWDYYRAKATRYPPLSTVSDPEAMEGVPAPQSAVGARPEARVLAMERRDQLRRLFAQLQEDHRTVLTLRIVDQLSVKETAALMGRSEPAVKMLQLRGLRAFAGMARAERSYFVDYLEGEEVAGHDAE